MQPGVSYAMCRHMGAMQGSGMLRERDGSVYEGMFDAGKVNSASRVRLLLCLHLSQHSEMRMGPHSATEQR